MRIKLSSSFPGLSREVLERLDSTEPESTEPESTKPESTELESTEPESTELESMELESMEPESMEPESTKLELIEVFHVGEVVKKLQVGSSIQWRQRWFR